MSERKYRHFIYLHVGIRILASDKLYRSHNKVAENYLCFFAYEFGELYGKNHLIYNLHSLIHLASECLTHGPLDVFSAFPFENFLGILKKKIRSPKNALAQLIKRISELNALGTYVFSYSFYTHILVHFSTKFRNCFSINV